MPRPKEEYEEQVRRNHHLERDLHLTRDILRDLESLTVAEKSRSKAEVGGGIAVQVSMLMVNVAEVVVAESPTGEDSLEETIRRKRKKKEKQNRKGKGKRGPRTEYQQVACHLLKNSSRIGG